MTVETQTWPLQGGLDLVSPALAISPGRAIMATNYEAEISGGYHRIDGYLPEDGSVDPQPVPGSGPIRGVWVFAGTLYAFRDAEDGLSTQMYAASPSGWIEIDTGVTLAPGGRFEFVNYNFTGSAATQRMYGCDGVNPAFQFDGSHFVQLSTGMSPDTPTHIAAHAFHLFLAFGESLQHSALGDPLNWTLAGGAGEVSVGRAVTALRGIQGGVLACLTGRTVFGLYGSSAADWELRTITEETGGTAYSSGYLENDLYFLSDSGITSLRTVQEFGDFASSSVSQSVKPFIDLRLDQVVAAITIPEKGQYRLFFADNSVIAGTFYGRQLVGYTTFHLADTPSCAVSSHGRAYFGTTDGYVMRMDTGTSFAGEAIESFLRLPFTHLKTPQRKKRFRKILIDVKAEKGADIGYSVDFEYGERGTTEYQATILGGGGFWDGASWDEFVWSSPAVSRIEGYLDGSGRNLSLMIRHKSASDPSFTLQGIQLNYSTRGLVR